MYLIAIFATAVASLVYSLWKYAEKQFSIKHDSAQQLPGPMALPIIGHLHLIGSKSLHVVLKELSDIYGSVFHLKLGSRKAVVLCDRDSVYEAFVKKAKDFAGRPDLPTFEYTRNGRIGISLCDYDDDFLVNRKKTVRAIHKMLADKDNLNEILQNESEKMVQYYNGFSESNKPFYPLNEFEKIVPSMFMLLMFNQNVSYDNPEFLSIVSTYRQWFDAAEADNPADFFPFLQNFPNKRLSIIEKCGKVFEEFSLKMINYSKQSTDNNNKEERKCLLNHLMNESVLASTEDEKELGKVVSDLVGGGFDTSVSSLSWALLYLIKQPDVLEKCRQEIIEATGKNPLTMSARDKCPYFSATLYEIYRVSSVVPTGLVHTALKDTTVKGFFIPKGTLVMPSLRQLNYDPDVWQTPDNLNPQNFLKDKETISRTSVSELAAFSFGIRRCPASDVAFCMNFVLLGTFIKEFTWEISQEPEDMSPMRGVTSKPKPYLITVSKVCC